MPNVLTQIKNNNAKIKSNCNCCEFFHKNLIAKFNTHKESNPFKNNYLSNNNFSCSTQFFHLGYLLLISALGGAKFDILDHVLNNEITNFYTLENKKHRNLFSLLISLQENSNFNKKSKNKFTIQNFINSKNFSENFVDFISQCLTFNQNNTNNLFLHPWLKVNNYIQLNNSVSRVRVSLKELIKITRESKKSQTNVYNKERMNNFLNNFEIILSSNQSIRTDELIKSINGKKSVCKELSSELGIIQNDLITMLQNKVIQNYKR
jgi:hypothetical protein